MSVIPTITNAASLRALVRDAIDGGLDAPARARVGDLLAKQLVDDVEMPVSLWRSKLEAALATSPTDPELTAFDRRFRSRVLAAWDTRLAASGRDQAWVGSQVASLLDAAPASLQSVEGVAQLSTLLSLSTAKRGVHSLLGFKDPQHLERALSSDVAPSLVLDGAAGTTGQALVANLALVHDAPRLAAWRGAIDAAARGRGELPPDLDLGMLLTPAARWQDRSRAQKMRLLDALASRDGRTSIVRERLVDRRNVDLYAHPDAQAHVSLQVARTLRGEADLPEGIILDDIVSSWHYRRADPADRLRVLEAFLGDRSTPLFKSYSLDGLDDVALDLGTRQVDDLLRAALRSGDDVPPWIGAEHLLLSKLPDEARLRLLTPYMRGGFDDLPADAPRWMPAELERFRGLAKASVDEVLVAVAAGAQELPTWIRVGDVLDATLPEADRLRLLQPFLRAGATNTPAGARVWLTATKLRLDDLAAAAGSHPGVPRLVQATSELLDRNLGRIAGSVHGGYANHPDYAEVGRVMANVELLDRLGRVTRATESAMELRW